MHFKISLSIISLILISACGPSLQEKEEIAIVTCNIMGESLNMNASMRIKEINEAREKIKEKRFLEGDAKIKESFAYGLCKELVMNDSDYENKLIELRELERIAKEKVEKLERLAREERDEMQKLAREKRNLVKITYGEYVQKTEWIDEQVINYLCYFDGIEVIENSFVSKDAEKIATIKNGHDFLERDDNRDIIKKDYPNCYDEFFQSYTNGRDLKHTLDLKW
jgi:hypothetical protein|tara:strand:+ start:24 stop:695 length:672 start_codon:yes stop_codon:yes gene_type:complete